MTRTDRKELMFNHISSWENSGKSQKAYCLEQELKLSTFYYWRKRYEEEQSDAGGFLPLTLDRLPAAGQILIEYSNGIRLHLPALTKVSDLRMLLKVF